ncbi:glycosyltransferase family 31 protein [Aspergillus undulatus]|uniref:glycosyltransferase family 31 protein n=1 Tax=Aspergillus undulatus TaxID=1810928 RepID=UPI003CCCC648
MMALTLLLHHFRFFYHNALQHRKFSWTSWKLLFLAAGFVLACLILFTYSATTGEPRFLDSALGADNRKNTLGGSEKISTSDNGDPNGSANACFVDLDLLRTHADNASTVEYARLTIGVVRTDNFTAFEDSLDIAIPPYRTLNLDTKATREPLQSKDDYCTTAVTIQAPLPQPPPDASHMIFGVATTLEKLEDSLDAITHWAARTNAHIVAVVEQGGSSTRSRIQNRAEILGLRITITQTEDDRWDRYFSLVRVLYQYHDDEKTQWAVLMDDDTFFPSMRNLIARLATYDATSLQYIGAMTEDLARLSGTGYMAYGGAGIFLSLPLLSDLQYVFETCHSLKDKGDRMLASCIYAHSTAKFTWERGLYQLDIHGDASGFFESGRSLPLSVHHWKSWFHADMVALGKVASICGDECLLRRFYLSKSKDWFLVNGYSVIQDATIWNEPRPMEQTWEGSKYKGSDPFAYSLGPLRRRDPDKVSLRLRDVRVNGMAMEKGNETISQIYVLNGTDEKPPRVLEVAWTVLQG